MAETATLLRVGAWVVLAVGSLMWISHHCGVAPGNLGWLAGAVAAITAALSSLDFLLEKVQQESLKGQLRRYAQIVFSVRVLAVLYVIFVIVVATVTSVTVSRGDSIPESSVKVALSALEDSSERKTGTLEKQSDSSLLRFIVVTGPFGRPFRVSAEGFVSEYLNVYPLIGRHITLGKDLKREPTLLLRMPANALVALKSGGKLSVIVVGSNQIVAYSDTAARAYRLGRDLPLPEGSRVRWLDVLKSEGIEKDPERQILSLREWARPHPVPTSVPVVPGLALRAVVTNESDAIVARADFIVADEPFIDLLLEEVAEGE